MHLSHPETIPHTPRFMEKLSSTKLGPSAKNFGDHCSMLFFGFPRNNFALESLHLLFFLLRTLRYLPGSFCLVILSPLGFPSDSPLLYVSS